MMRYFKCEKMIIPIGLILLLKVRGLGKPSLITRLLDRLELKPPACSVYLAQPSSENASNLN